MTVSEADNTKTGFLDYYWRLMIIYFWIWTEFKWQVSAASSCSADGGSAVMLDHNCEKSWAALSTLTASFGGSRTV